MALALGVDPRELLRIVLTEYAPDAFAMLEEVVGSTPIISQGEAAILVLVRNAAKGRVLRLEDATLRTRFADAVAEIAEIEDSRSAAAVARLDSRPSNSRHR